MITLAMALLYTAIDMRQFSEPLQALGAGLLVAAVLFLAGCAWGWPVQRDRTLVWAVLQHSLFLVLMSMFEWR